MPKSRSELSGMISVPGDEVDLRGEQKWIGPRTAIGQPGRKCYPEHLGREINCDISTALQNADWEEHTEMLSPVASEDFETLREVTDVMIPGEDTEEAGNRRVKRPAKCRLTRRNVFVTANEGWQFLRGLHELVEPYHVRHADIRKKYVASTAEFQPEEKG